jgi:hypothetical protein
MMENVNVFTLCELRPAQLAVIMVPAFAERLVATPAELDPHEVGELVAQPPVVLLAHSYLMADALVVCGVLLFRQRGLDLVDTASAKEAALVNDQPLSC